MVLSAQNWLEQSNYDVKCYEIEIQINDTSTDIRSETKIYIELLEESDSLLLNFGRNLIIDSLLINRKPVGFSHELDSLYVYSKSLKKGTLNSIEITYHGDADYNGAPGALFNRENKYGKFTYSVTEPYATKYWYPCKEILKDKADSVFVSIIVPKGLKAGSLGMLDTVVNVSPKQDLYRWKSYYPTAFYLVSVAVGDYYEYTNYYHCSHCKKPMPVVNYIYNSPEFFQDQKPDIDVTIDLLELFAHKFGEYPFVEEKYGHCLVPTGGGMEHQTMTTIGNFGFELVAHELGHQWFGNQVTCSYWNDIWINEGFASYCEYIALEELKSIEQAHAWMDYAHTIIKEAPGGSTYVWDKDLANRRRVFDGRLTYKKGAALIHMIRFVLEDDDLFFSILQEFLVQYNFKNATGEDFRKLLEKRSGIDFNKFFNEWYYGEGYPIYDIEWFQTAGKLYLISKQSASEPSITSSFTAPFNIKCIFPTADTILKLWPSTKVDTHKIDLTNPVYSISVNTDRKSLLAVNSIKQNKVFSAAYKKVVLYPNPVGEQFTIFTKEIAQPFTLLIYDVYGKQLAVQENVQPTGGVVSTRALQPGAYFAHIKSTGVYMIYPFVKN